MFVYYRLAVVKIDFNFTGFDEPQSRDTDPNMLFRFLLGHPANPVLFSSLPQPLPVLSIPARNPFFVLPDSYSQKPRSLPEFFLNFLLELVGSFLPAFLPPFLSLAFPGPDETKGSENPHAGLRHRKPSTK